MKNILILMLCGVGCKEIPKYDTNIDTTLKITHDTVVYRYTQSNDDLGSRTLLAVDYYQREVNCKIKSDEYAVKYYQTGEEQYRLKANRYGDSINYWYLKLDSIHKIISK